MGTARRCSLGGRLTVDFLAAQELHRAVDKIKVVAADLVPLLMTVRFRKVRAPRLETRRLVAIL